MYHQVGTLMYMAMSIDASCLGLTDATSGSLTMEMNKGSCIQFFNVTEDQDHLVC